MKIIRDRKWNRMAVARVGSQCLMGTVSDFQAERVTGWTVVVAA